MSEANLESALARVADDLSSATEAIREEVANRGKAPRSRFLASGRDGQPASSNDSDPLAVGNPDSYSSRNRPPKGQRMEGVARSVDRLEERLGTVFDVAQGEFLAGGDGLGEEDLGP